MQLITEILERAVDFSHVLNLSITASWLILAVLLLRLCLRRAPRWISAALWGLVAIRLLLPFSIESGLSLIPSAETVPEELLRYEGAQLQEPARLDIVDNPALYHEDVSIELPQSVDRVQWSIVRLTLPWLMGVGLMLLYAAGSYFKLRRQVGTAVRLRENIYQSEHVPSPFVLGVIRPGIYLPFAISEESLPHVIAHEQAHIRRRDHWWKPLGFLLLSVHWFNPLMWLAYWLLCRDIELACDEKVIKELGAEGRADYSQALLKCSAGRSVISACPLAFGETDVKTRVKSVLNYKKPAFWVIVAAALACAVVAVCFLTDPESPDKNPDAYYLRIGGEGVMSVEVSTPHSSGGIVNADGAPFKVGHEVWLEQLEGITDLRGVSVTALGRDGEILYALSFPAGASRAEISQIIGGDGWFFAPASAVEKGGRHFGVTIERDGSITGENLPNMAFHPLEDETPAYKHGLSAGNLAGLEPIPYTFPNNQAVNISYTVYSGANAPENISMTDTVLAPDGSFLHVDENGRPIGQEAKFTREKIPGGERFTCTLEPSQFNLALSSAGPHNTLRCFSLRYQAGGQWNEVCFVLRTAEKYVNPASGDQVLKAATGATDDQLEAIKDAIAESRVGAVNGAEEESLPTPQPVAMQPTEASLTGPYDSYLFLPLNGAAYRYERTDGGLKEYTRGELLLSCVEDTGFEQFQWEVYSIEESPEHSLVWAEAEGVQPMLYQYSPPKRSAPDALDKARAENAVIMEDGDVKSGQEAWAGFVSAAEAGERASIQVAHYHTLNEGNSHPDYYEAHKEDYPRLYMHTLQYDGEVFTLSGEGEEPRQYRHLMHYTGEAPTATAIYKTFERYVLTHDDTVTWEELERGMLSSRLGDYIPHYTVYTDLRYKDED